MLIVVDASVAVKWLVTEEGSSKAEQLLGRGHALHAPRLMAAEILNAVRNKERSGELTPQDAIAIGNQARHVPVLWGNDEELGPVALQLALDLQHPIYDCMYLALAQRNRGLVVTADARFFDLVSASVYAGMIARLDVFEPG